MGGMGSGRPSSHHTTGACRAIDLAKVRNTVGWRSYSWSLGGQSLGSVSYAMTAQALKLRFSADGREQGVEIPVTYTHPHLGGERQWLQCRCGRRCRIIYMGGAGWRCRHCYRLTYQTQREDRSSRAQRQAGKIVRRLGGDDCDWFPNRPRGMHQRTYDRLGERFERQHQIMDDALVERAAALVNRWGPR